MRTMIQKLSQIYKNIVLSTQYNAMYVTENTPIVIAVGITTYLPHVLVAIPLPYPAPPPNNKNSADMLCRLKVFCIRSSFIKVYLIQLTMEKKNEEVKIKCRYKYAFSTDNLRNIRKPFSTNNNESCNAKPKKDTPPKITSCVNHTQSELTVIGQSNGKIIYWRPRRLDLFDENISTTNDNSKLACYKFDGHYDASIHSICYGMEDIMDRNNHKYGLIISGGADSKIKVWDPWHRHEKSKQFPILEIDKNNAHSKYHNGTILCLKYANKQLISTSTDCTVRIWMVNISKDTDYQKHKEMYFKKAKLRKVATMREEKLKYMTDEKRLRIAKSEPIRNAFNHHLSNAQHFRDPNYNRFKYLTDLEKENDGNSMMNRNGKVKKKKTGKGFNNSIDDLIYPDIQCQQIIQFDSWCTSIYPSINNNRAIIYVGDDKGKLYSFNTLSTTRVMKHSSKVKTIFVHDENSSLVYHIEHRSKLHRLSIIFMLYVSNANYIITLSSDHTLQVHDAITYDALFGVRNPGNCKYLSADYNHDYKELYVVGIYYMFIFHLFIK